MKLKHAAIPLLILFALIQTACEEKIVSQTRPYMAEKQPLFFHNGQIQHIKSDNPVIHRIVLIGDAGKADQEPGKSALRAFSKRFKKLNDNEEILLFLGDNIYPEGFQEQNTECGNKTRESKILDAQLILGQSGRSISYFVPGNHDWDYHDKPDIQVLKKQRDYIRNCGRKADMFPSNSEGLTLASALNHELYTMIFLDSQSLMYAKGEKQKRTYDLIEGFLKMADSKKPIIIAAHHPLATHGPHGGCYQQDYFGHSIINFFRRNGISWGQDINATEYAAFIERMNKLIPVDKKVIFVAGHDHGLQVLQQQQKEGADFVIVSGAGSKTDPVCLGEDSLFAQETLGFIELGFHQGGELKAEAFSYIPQENRLNKVYSQRLF